MFFFQLKLKCGGLVSLLLSDGMVIFWEGKQMKTKIKDGVALILGLKWDKIFFSFLFFTSLTS